MIINEDKMKERFPNAYAYLRENKEKLMKRKMDKNIQWYAFGRSENYKNKRPIRSLIFLQ